MTEIYVTNINTAHTDTTPAPWLCPQLQHLIEALSTFFTSIFHSSQKSQAIPEGAPLGSRLSKKKLDKEDGFKTSGVLDLTSSEREARLEELDKLDKELTKLVEAFTPGAELEKKQGLIDPSNPNETSTRVYASPPVFKTETNPKFAQFTLSEIEEFERDLAQQEEEAQRDEAFLNTL